MKKNRNIGLSYRAEGVSDDIEVRIGRSCCNGKKGRIFLGGRGGREEEEKEQEEEEKKEKGIEEEGKKELTFACWGLNLYFN